MKYSLLELQYILLVKSVSTLFSFYSFQIENPPLPCLLERKMYAGVQKVSGDNVCRDARGQWWQWISLTSGVYCAAAKQQTLAKCRIDVGLMSQKSAQHYSGIGSTFRASCVVGVRSN